MKKSKWVSAKVASEKLGICQKHLNALRPQLVKGVHYRNIAKKIARRATYRYNLEELEKFLAKN